MLLFLDVRLVTAKNQFPETRLTEHPVALIVLNSKLVSTSIRMGLENKKLTVCWRLAFILCVLYMLVHSDCESVNLCCVPVCQYRHALITKRYGSQDRSSI